MKIGVLARRSGCAVQTIRYYEREGLLPAAVRSEGNYRMYGTAELERLTFIRNCRGLDMSLAEIRRLLALRDGAADGCGDVNALVDAHIEHVRARIASLQGLQAQLVGLRQACKGSAGAACQILERLNAGEVAHPAPDGRSHLAATHHQP